jgi:hypothetical protein
MRISHATVDSWCESVSCADDPRGWSAGMLENPSTFSAQIVGTRSSGVKGSIPKWSRVSTESKRIMASACPSSGFFFAAAVILGRPICGFAAGTAIFPLRVDEMLFAVVAVTTTLLASAFFTAGFVGLGLESLSPLRRGVGFDDLIMATLGSGGMKELFPIPSAVTFDRPAGNALSLRRDATRRYAYGYVGYFCEQMFLFLYFCKSSDPRIHIPYPFS